MFNSYVRVENSLVRGEWAFKDGVSTPLGTQSAICRYEQLHENPGLFYIEDDWSGENLPRTPLPHTIATNMRLLR